MSRAASVLVFLGLAVALAAGGIVLSDDDKDLKTEEFFWGGRPWGLHRGGFGGGFGGGWGGPWGGPWGFNRGGFWGSPWGYGSPYAGFSAGIGPFGGGFGFGRFGGWW